MCHEDKDITSADDIADAFNVYFTNVGPIEVNKIDADGTNHGQYLSEPSELSFFLMPTDCIEVLYIVKSLENSHFCGHDDLSTSLLKQIIGFIVRP